jgi:hypothetical protein
LLGRHLAYRAAGWQGGCRGSAAARPSGAFRDAQRRRVSLDPNYQFISADGRSIDNASTGGVPEPMTWAMLLVGFAGLGVALRRRRGQAATAA